MAVHSLANTFPPGFFNKYVCGNVMEDQQHQLGVMQSNACLGMDPFFAVGSQPHIFNATVPSDPHSDLTCNAPRSTKRARQEQEQQDHSAMTSTSGRSSSIAEIDALLRVHSEKIREGVEAARKRQRRAVVCAVEEHVRRRMKEKEMELESVSSRNAELEEKVRQIAAERQIWFNLAKNNEALVSTLRTTLQQLLLNNSNGNGKQNDGFCDADDAQSCCDGNDEDATGKRTCKVCGGGDVSVLVLPCRHLCLCPTCESAVDTCPVCHAVKNASLQISVS